MFLFTRVFSLHLPSRAVSRNENAETASTFLWVISGAHFHSRRYTSMWRKIGGTAVGLERLSAGTGSATVG